MFNSEAIGFPATMEAPPFPKIAPYSWSADLSRPLREPTGEVSVRLTKKGGVSVKPTLWSHPQVQNQVSWATREDSSNRGVASIDGTSVSYPTIRDP